MIRPVFSIAWYRHRFALTMRQRPFLTTAVRTLLMFVFIFELTAQAALSATPGLPFTEDFSSSNLKDSAKTNANWSVEERKVYMAWRHAQYGALSTGVTGTDITTDAHNTYAMALGDVDGDGDLDVVAGNYGQPSRLYLNNGTTDPFTGVTGSDITTDAYSTWSIALGDVDGDGDLDVVTGNVDQPNRLYLNNGTADPFNGISGTDITSDANNTHAIALGDMDGDGDLDAIAGNWYQRNRLYLNNGTAEPFNGVTGIDITADVYFTDALVLGDVDGDGDLDVVAANAVNQRNRLYLNNGTADPFSGVTGADITTDAHNTSAIALGDMDGDGDLDIVAGNSGVPNRLCLNNGTADPFNGVSGKDITTDTHDTYAISLGDVDGDGDMDVVVGIYWKPTRIYLNNGTADPFSNVTGTNITTDTYATMAIAMGDMDGDGDLDVVSGNSGQNRLYLNNATENPFNGVTGMDITTDADETNAIALGDVDGDGDLDVVAAKMSRNRLYLNNGTTVPFNGVTGKDIATDSVDTRAIAMGDMDGDGDLDVVVANVGRNRLYLNNGTADPYNGVTGKDITTDADDLRAIALGDVDGDGDLDVVAGNAGRNRLYLNNGTADPFNGVTGKDITTDADDTRAIALGDVDGDGDLDVVVGNVGRNRLYLSNGTADPFNGVTGKDITTDVDDTRAIALGDVDGDGDLDVVAGNAGRNRLYLNNGTVDPFNGVTGKDITTDADDLRAIALGDVDGDGDLDVVAGSVGRNRLYLNNGTADPFNGVTGNNITTDVDDTRAIALGDVDGDGDLDVVAGNIGVNRLHLNNSRGKSFNAVTGIDITVDAYATFDIALGDMDGDGDLDVVAGNYFSQPIRLYLNNGTAYPFNGVTGTNITSDAMWTWAIALGDVDGDGDLDVVVGNYGYANRLYLNNGTADPFAGVTGKNITADEYNTFAISLGDVDSDGDLDVVAGNSNQPNRLYLNNGTADPFSSVTGTNITSDAHATYAIALGDVDGDGDLDVVAGNESQPNRLYLNNGTADPFSSVTGTNITVDAYATRAIALGDVEGDGDLDVVAGNFWDQPNRLYLNNGTANPFSGVTGTVITSDAHDTMAIALGDMDGDGDLDVVAGNFYHPNYIYLNNGTANPFNGAMRIDITSDSHATCAIALGDVDGDGDLDVVKGNDRQPNRLYMSKAHDTGKGRVQSLTVDTQSGNIASGKLTAAATTPDNTAIDWYMSNNGGVKWSRVRSGKWFVFPTTGSDMRWKAELRSLSPALSPAITQVTIETDITAPVNPTQLNSTDHTVGVRSNDNTVTMQWSRASDNSGTGVAGYSFLFDTSPTTAPDTVIDLAQGVDPQGTVSSSLADGNSHYFHLRTCDNAGNCSAAVHLGPFFIDTTPPQADHQAVSTVRNLSKAITLTATDALATSLTYSITAQPAHGSLSGSPPNVLYTPVADYTGQDSFTFKASDDLQSSNTAVVIITVLADTSPPVLSVSALADGSVTNNASLNVSGTVTDNVGVQSLVISGATVTLNPNGAYSHLVTLTTGSNTITVVATDIAGNQTTDTRTVVLDQTAPGLFVTGPADNSATSQPVSTVTGTVNETSTVSVRLNSGSAQLASMIGSSFTATVNLASGMNTIDITATDLAGNMSSAKRTVTYDPLAPSVAITSPGQDLLTSRTTVTIEGTVSDSLTPVTATITVDGNTAALTVASGAFSHAVTFTTEGIHSILVTATDQAGNTASVQRNILYAKLGDSDGSGSVSLSDAIKALRHALGVEPITDPVILQRCDVAPLGQDGKPAPDGVVDIGDVIVTLQMAVGLVSW